MERRGRRTAGASVPRTLHGGSAIIRVVPPLIRRYIKTSFVFLVGGLLLGGWIVVRQFVVGVYPARLLITAHVHLLLVGFMLGS